MAYEFILSERKGRITYITLNRPQLLNAVNDTMHQELVDALSEFDTDEEAWIAILSGKGRCFSSGADVKQRQLRPREELERLGGPSAVNNCWAILQMCWVISAVEFDRMTGLFLAIDTGIALSLGTQP